MPAAFFKKTRRELFSFDIRVHKIGREGDLVGVDIVNDFIVKVQKKFRKLHSDTSTFRQRHERGFEIKLFFRKSS